MSNKEKMLIAARSCLLTRGYSNTSVRDLVAASGANQASINYHFGSKEKLLNQALFDLNREWGELLFVALEPTGGRGETSRVPSRAESEERWSRVIDSIQANRELWFVNFESIPYAQHDEAIRQMNASGQAMSRTALARAFAGLDSDSDDDRIRAVGSHYYSLLVGTALQWLTDPEHAPSAADVAHADTFVHLNAR